MEAPPITFEVPGDPVPQPRARISIRNGKPRGYTKREHPIHAYRQAVELLAKAHGGKAQAGPFQVVAEFVFGRPKSHWRKSGLSPKAPAFPFPDGDNLAKGFLDAITNSGAVWIDDSQVVDGRYLKRYAERGEPARTIVSIRRLS